MGVFLERAPLGLAASLFTIRIHTEIGRNPTEPFFFTFSEFNSHSVS
jgi:hypothetical protein